MTLAWNMGLFGLVANPQWLKLFAVWTIKSPKVRYFFGHKLYENHYISSFLSILPSLLGFGPLVWILPRTIFGNTNTALNRMDYVQWGEYIFHKLKIYSATNEFTPSILKMGGTLGVCPILIEWRAFNQNEEGVRPPFN